MSPLSPRLMAVVSIGHAMLFCLALVGAIRMVGYLVGAPISDGTANAIFMIGSLLTAPFAAYFRLSSLVLAGVPQPAKVR